MSLRNAVGDGWVGVKNFEAIKLEGELVAEWLAFVDSKSQLK